MAAKNNDTKQFVWFNSYTAAAMRIPDDGMRMELINAIVMYGALGQEPNFGNNGWVLSAIFEGLRPNIDNSVAAYSNSTKPPAPGKKKRGRPRKTPAPIVDDVDAFASGMEIPDHIIDAMADTAMMEEMEVW